jgi:hypothetical protein
MDTAWLVLGAVAAGVAGMLAGEPAPAAQRKVRARVELEEEVYTCPSPDNGAGPMWAYGSTCIVRIGDEVFISGLELVPEAKPLNNVRWLLFRRAADGWQVADRGTGRTREPCPLACFHDGMLLLSDNPTLTPPDQYAGPARPEILAFEPPDWAAPGRTILPVWQGSPEFTEHSYRSFAADGGNRELILFQNVGYDGADWAFLDRNGRWSAQGSLAWPWGAEYPKPEPVRVCYPTVALRDRKVYFCGVSDIVEPYPEWRQFKQELTGQDWDYDFRRLFFTWSDDIRKGKFHDWVEVASRDRTCGWVRPCDLWLAADGTVHLLWTERALDERLRERFFPGEKQTVALMHAMVRSGKVVGKAPIQIGGEGLSDEMPGNGRFHVAADGRLYVFYYVGGKDAAGQPISENRVVEIHSDGTLSAPTVVRLARPFTGFYSATWRAGVAPGDVLDLYGPRAGDGQALSYARIRIR